MVLTTKQASYIIVLGIVIFVLAISSTLLQDGYHVCFKQKTVNKGEEDPIKHWGSPRNERAQSINLLSDGIPDGISMCNSDTIPTTISERTEGISEAIPNSNSETISETIPEPIPIIPIAAHCFKKAGFGRGFVKQSASISAVGT